MAAMEPPAKVRKANSSFRERLQRSRSDPPNVVTDLDPTQPGETQSLSQPAFSVEPLQLAEMALSTGASPPAPPDVLRKDDKLRHDSCLVHECWGVHGREALQKLRRDREVHLPQLTSPEQLPEERPAKQAEVLIQYVLSMLIWRAGSI
eukprot:Skav228623  [mRNA]  locus=scaffold2037:424390:426980:+ [translate_table: standard]